MNESLADFAKIDLGQISIRTHNIHKRNHTRTHTYTQPSIDLLDYYAPPKGLNAMLRFMRRFTIYIYYMLIANYLWWMCAVASVACWIAVRFAWWWMRSVWTRHSAVVGGLIYMCVNGLLSLAKDELQISKSCQLDWIT